MSKQRISFEIPHELYEQLCSYAKGNEMSASAVIRLAARKFVELHKIDVKPTQVTPTKPAKPDHDPEVRGADGYTRAEREALYARMEQSKDTPWEPPPPVPMQTNTVSPQIKRDVLSEWGDE